MTDRFKNYLAERKAAQAAEEKSGLLDSWEGFKPGDRVRVIGGLWSDAAPAEADHPRTGVIVNIHRNKFYMVDGPLMPVFSVKWDVPFGAYTVQDWYPKQVVKA